MAIGTGGYHSRLNRPYSNNGNGGYIGERFPTSPGSCIVKGKFPFRRELDEAETDVMKRYPDIRTGFKE